MDEFLKLLENYYPETPHENAERREIITFARANVRCFDHDYLPGHVTGSALVTNRRGTEVLLHHHRKLGLWIQFGGHSDGSAYVAATAMREAREESGLKTLTFHKNVEGIFDVSIHAIPEYQNAPAHTHYDIRFLLTGDPKEPFVQSSESLELQWVKLEDVGKYNTEPDFHRMINKIRNQKLR